MLPRSTLPPAVPPQSNTQTLRKCAQICVQRSGASPSSILFCSWHQPQIAAQSSRHLAQGRTSDPDSLADNSRDPAKPADTPPRPRSLPAVSSARASPTCRQILCTSVSGSTALNTTCRTGARHSKKKTCRTRPRICSRAKSSGFHPLTCRVTHSCSRTPSAAQSAAPNNTPRS